jgi:hypothetical protein
VAVAPRRPVSLRSGSTAAAAAARAAPTAIMGDLPARHATGADHTEGSGGTCMMGRVPPSPTGIELAKAAVAAPRRCQQAGDDRGQHRASRPRRAPACPAAIQ